MWVYRLIKTVKTAFPQIKIYIWSGYYYEELINSNNEYVIECLRIADILIDGPYVEKERDITLPMRGSRNQRIIDLTLNK